MYKAILKKLLMNILIQYNIIGLIFVMLTFFIFVFFGLMIHATI